eukprot:CAMPEP_0115444824 /NCGR_PEP_ID=MMETSP0271-20121206/38596_1 /TAXON_ID=71861 /ORGANISM="Scrippsiella trochoidea, Strain CCMP3099" /LENGTH=60 /DNA_ID=CAMNT_0002870769 /DNA_START=48 /DNA_END=227 /DNA_ORIENTATION=+
MTSAEAAAAAAAAAPSPTPARPETVITARADGAINSQDCDSHCMLADNVPRKLPRRLRCT